MKCKQTTHLLDEIYGVYDIWCKNEYRGQIKIHVKHIWKTWSFYEKIGKR
jgi:hypothetical protein